MLCKIKYIVLVSMLFLLLNAEEQINTDDNNISEILNNTEDEDETKNTNFDFSFENKNKQSSYIENKNKQSLIDNVYGHMGFFGKTNSLNKNYKNDNYAVFSGSVGLKYTFDFDNEIKSNIQLNIGLYIMTELYKNNNPNKYVENKFLTNNAFLKVSDTFYEIKAGRYKANRDWINHYVQGLSIDANYSWLRFWGDWVDDQAYVNREMLSEFDIFQKNYKSEWLIGTGINTTFYGINISPYYYLLNKNFWASGVKLGFETNINDNWDTKTSINYAYLKSKMNKNNSNILWIDQEIDYKIDTNNLSTNVLFGLGLIKIWGYEFELAKIGNRSRFETSEYRSYSVIETGGINNGLNSTNMFYDNTITIYGFAGFRINNISMMVLGRDSRNMTINQESYSIGGKYKIINGFYAGGLVSYMTENNKNKSFAKLYLEFII